ncbi:hypothetical protein GJ699_32260, partial [Duganella sp. FT80W]
KQLHLELKELGYEGSYDRVAAFARQWKAGQLEWVNSASKRTIHIKIARKRCRRQPKRGRRKSKAYATTRRKISFSLHSRHVFTIMQIMVKIKGPNGYRQLRGVCGPRDHRLGSDMQASERHAALR